MISFSDPSVNLKRLYGTASATSNLSQSRKASGNNERLIFLSNKGNEGLAARQPHTCSLCSKVFSNRFNLKDHLETFHLKTKEMFCDLCPKTYFTNKTLTYHMKSVHCKKKFTCHICDYKTAIRCVFQKHKVVHAEKVKCLICHKQVSSLKDHMTTHKPKEKCSICNKMYSKKQESRHMKIHAREAYKCERCEKAFDNKESFRR